jgi:sterol desaturase/sphingolipid hydroxylase (fatty acid hydroxylase superfamily)
MLGGWAGSSIRHYRPAALSLSKCADLFLTALPLVGIADLWVRVTTFGLSYFIGVGANRILTMRLGIPSLDTGNLIADGLLFYLIYSFFFYWNHRILHVWPFWTLHRFHH